MEKIQEMNNNFKLYFEEKLKYSTEYKINIDERVIYLEDELEYTLGTYLRIRYDLIKTWYNQVYEKKLSDITLDISSYGGNIYALNGALDFSHHLAQDGVVIHTRAQGVCMSIATLLLAAGTGVRCTYPNTIFLLHDIQIEGIEGSAQQIKHSSKTIEQEQYQFFSYYATFSNKEKVLTEKEFKIETKKWLKKYTNNNDHYLTAEKMLELKLIDKIL